MLNFNRVDISERKDHLDYFMSLANPHAELTVDVDVTKVVEFCKVKRYPFFLVCLHVFACAAESVSELKRRIHIINKSTDGVAVSYEIREYEKILTSHTERGSNNTYCYCTIHHDMFLEEYIKNAIKAQIIARRNNSVVEREEDAEGYLFASCIPWIHYKALSNPTNGPQDSNPRISWGKYEPDYKGRLVMPVTLTVHHGLVDGIHMAEFFDNIPNVISDILR